jgi:hypothetical protein
MSSTIDISSILSSISVMETQLAALRAQLGVASSGAKSSPVKTSTEKKERKKSDAPPTAWRIFADRVRELLRSNGYEGKAIGTECVQFCSTLKAENAELSAWSDADILARRADWTAPEVSKQKASGKSYRKKKSDSSSASVQSDGGSVNLAPVSAEAEAPAVTDGEASVSSDKKKPGPAKGKKWSAETKAAAAAKRAAKKASKTTEDAPVSSSVVAPPPLPASPEDSGDEDELAGFQRVSLGGARYWVNMKNGHAYQRESDDSRGDWAGLFVRDPKPRIDDSVPDPNAELTFTDVDELD